MGDRLGRRQGSRLAGMGVWARMLVAAFALFLSGCVKENPGEIRLVIASGHATAFQWIEMVRDFFVPEIDRRLAALGGERRIVWTEAYGGSLTKLGSELETLEAGLVDVGFISTVFEDKLPLQSVTYLAPFGTDDMKLVLRIINDLQQEIPGMLRGYSDYNLMLLGGGALETYDLYSNFPVETLEDLAGRKILAPGISANWLRDTGAIGVAGDLATYYSDLKTGVADGVLTLATGAWGARLHEVAPYLTRVNIGSQFGGGVVINLDVWRSLDPDIQQIFLEVGREYSTRLAINQQQRADAHTDRMIEEGLIVSELSREERRRWAYMIPNVAKPWSELLESRGLPARAVLRGFIDGLQAAGEDVPRDWSRE